MLDPKFIENFASCVDKRVTITAAAGDTDTEVLEVYEQLVEVNSAAGTLTLYLPDVNEAQGKFYSITALTGATKTVTVAERSANNSYDWQGDLSLNADLDRALLFSDGKKWWVLTDMFT